VIQTTNLIEDIEPRCERRLHLQVASLSLPGRPGLGAMWKKMPADANPIEPQVINFWTRKTS
jgi:hypothetical protein